MRTHHLPNRKWFPFVVISATLAAIELPVRLLLGYEKNAAVAYFDWALTIIFSADMLFHLQRAKSFRGKGRVAAAYGKWWFFADLLAVIPFRLLPVPALFQLFRLLKLARIAELMGQWRHSAVHHANILRLAFFLFWLGLLTHWIACGWLALRGITPEFDKGTHYLRSLYWCVTTLATVGYGDITPTSNPQMVYAIVVMMLGAAVYGYTIANVASILANIDPAKVRYHEIVEKLTAFMKYRNIPPHLQHRILDYNAYLWEKRLGYDETAAISGLPPNLRADILIFLNGEIIEKVPLFRGASEEFIRAVALEMRPVIFTPNDCIMRAGEPGLEMYFISRGTVEIVSPDGQTVYATLTAGDFFGEMALLLNQPRVATARAVDYCDLYMLEKETFDRILARFPDFAAHIGSVAGKRQEKNKTDKT